ncbi:hypothetical protein SAMN05446037_104925 [Anaerovirgula multivorans]|uniref:Uncharacterized protein n=1 Tax=Anaerovirgula multivorans TaxID=312168 RepID=A0A239KKU1_9FIRM|nr:hypothetical protein [Anaerovirgula multivorans]SNT18781.1 hypothetical protein SAMN05446037_104925 [Anaerovirgula multivorans]
MPEIFIAKEDTSQEIKTTANTINTKVGTNTDVAGTTTLFARLKQIYDYCVGTIYSYLTTNMSSTRMSKVDNLDTTVSSRQANWGATTTHSGRIDTTISSRQASWGGTTTHRDRIDATISSRAAQTTANTINTNVGSNSDTSSATGSVHGKLKDVKAAINTLAAKLPIQPTKMKIVDTKATISSSSSYITAVDITGRGVLTRISLCSASSSVVTNAYHGLRVTVDGEVSTWSGGSSSAGNKARSFSNDTNVSHYILNIYFKSTLKVEYRNVHTNSTEFHIAVDYAIE